jgi:hypothetical protein
MTVATELTIDSRRTQVDQLHGDDQDVVQHVSVAGHVATCAPDADAFETSCQDLWVTIVDSRRAVPVGK